MNKGTRSFFYAAMCLGLIAVAYAQLPASFYTLSIILMLFAVFFALNGVRLRLSAARANARGVDLKTKS